MTSQHSIHCRHCGTDNPVKPDVVGKLCDHCGQDIYTPEFEVEIAVQPPSPKPTADRTGDVLRVVCPHCGFKNEFPEFSMVDIFCVTTAGSRWPWMSRYSNTRSSGFIGSREKIDKG